MTDWLVRLRGDNSNLRALSRLLCSRVCNVTEQGGNYFLRVAGFEGLTDPKEVEQLAKKRIAQLRGSARPLFGDIDRIDIASILRTEPGGQVNNQRRAASEDSPSLS